MLTSGIRWPFRERVTGANVQTNGTLSLPLPVFLMRFRSLLALLVFSSPGAALAQSATPPTAPPAAMSAIREADLKRDLFALAGDAMRGREGATLDELRASVWLADQLRTIGVEPMGDDGSYFQWWNILRQRVGASSTVQVGERSFRMWDDIAVSGNTGATIRASTVWADDGRDTTIDVRGKVAIAQLPPPPASRRETSVNSPEYRYARSAMQTVGFALTRRGALAVILIADSTADIAFPGVVAIAARGTYKVDDPEIPPYGGVRQPGPPVFMVRQREGAALRAAAGQRADIQLVQESFTAPSVNIVGRIVGTDAALRDEYVLFSSHQDHDGVRYDVGGDSIWNGADDNGTVSVALLAIARAFKQQPGRRSALFVYHGSEERGLLGSNYHVRNPVVPFDKIVAVLNGDMIGRNNPDSASLLGIQPPHRNSVELVEMALQANNVTGRFALDSLWDRPTHPEGWYFRSDHLPYAQHNIPAVMFSTNLHPDYHTPRDEPERIDYAKLTRMTQWFYMTGWLVANNPKRPALDVGFRLER